MDNGQEKVGILYWGNRGGGKVLTEQLISQSEEAGLTTITFFRPKKKGKRAAANIVSVSTWLRERRRVIQESIQLQITIMIIPMASPWDVLLGKKLAKSGIRVTRIIHDATTHPGDHFPTKIWIKVLCFDCTKIVTLSKFVANKLVEFGYAELGKINIAQLPRVEYQLTHEVDPTAPRRNFLFIGRGREYKGLDLLLSAWPVVGDSKSTLTIAGEGHHINKVVSRVRHINRWLSDSEVIELIQEADVIILPYIEASQSGIIPIALALHKPVVITPVGGLTEQIIDGVNGIVTSQVSSTSLAESLLTSITHKFTWYQSDIEFNRSPTLIEMCTLK
jgi:glycosyltransferase involved in cell wall biosynthesis